MDFIQNRLRLSDDLDQFQIVRFSNFADCATVWTNKHVPHQVFTIYLISVTAVAGMLQDGNFNDQFGLGQWRSGASNGECLAQDFL